ncbi:MAG TPA: hydroxymethylbilane synthase [Nitrospiria bacterium]
MVKQQRIIIGTRGSPLALWQAHWVKSQLEDRWKDLSVELRRIKTTGDKITEVPLAKVGGKGLFTKEIEEALLRKEIDLAVHSMKDVPTVFPCGLHLAAIPKREDPRDVLISRENFLLKQLPRAARIGTCSLRRQAQLLNFCKTFEICQLRGNVDTRLRKLRQTGKNGLDAIVLAAAGLKRLGWEEQVTEYLSMEVSLPAIGQGAIGIECRVEDPRVNDRVGVLNDVETHQCVFGERGFLKRLEGGCQVPIAAYGVIREGTFFLDGLVASVAGDRVIRYQMTGEPQGSELVGKNLAEHLLKLGAGEVLKEITGAEL